ncbi:hypothetical protein TcCL_NonESM03706 [Trypanosoma cruzi]|nr:hypothetical protein TcCL_NonESM03706 [Trypanosoma cruzi]
MAGGRIAATWSASALVCRARHRDHHVMQPFGSRSGASGHFAFCRDSATRHGGCVRLCGKWEDDGVTDLIASARLCVGDCTVVGIVYDRMPLLATVFGYCYCCLLFFFFFERAVRDTLALPAQLSFQGVRYYSQY